MRDEAAKKTGTINGRISAQLRARLDAIYTKHAVSDSEMLQDALNALANYVEKAGGYHRPMRMVAAGPEYPLPQTRDLNEPPGVSAAIPSGEKPAGRRQKKRSVRATGGASAGTAPAS